MAQLLFLYNNNIIQVFLDLRFILDLQNYTSYLFKNSHIKNAFTFFFWLKFLNTTHFTFYIQLTHRSPHNVWRHTDTYVFLTNRPLSLANTYFIQIVPANMFFVHKKKKKNTFSKKTRRLHQRNAEMASKKNDKELRKNDKFSRCYPSFFQIEYG